MSGFHGDHVPVEVTRRWRAILTTTAAIGLVLVLGATVALWPRDGADRLRRQMRHVLTAAVEVPAARVESVELGACPTLDTECQLAEVRLLEGEHRGQTFVLELVLESDNPILSTGDEIVLNRYSTQGSLAEQYFYADQQRRPVLWVLLAVFALAVVLLGRGRGLGALAGLATSLLVVFWFLVPAILEGRSPQLVAVVATLLVAYLALYMAHGLHGWTRAGIVASILALWSATMGLLAVGVLAAIAAAACFTIRLAPLLVRTLLRDGPPGVDLDAWLPRHRSSSRLAMTHVALIGTVAALGLILLLAVGFTHWAGFRGFASDHTGVLRFAAGEISLPALVFAGYVIAALGALDDVTVTQASTVFELRALDPTASPRRLFTAGLQVGRDHVASAVNTLALAYVGSSLPLVLLFVLGQQTFGDVVNSEAVAVEIVGALVGSIGLVVAVPITTALAAAVAAPAVVANSDVRPSLPGRGSRPAPSRSRACRSS